MRIRKLFLILFLTSLVMVACGGGAPASSPGALKVVASTTIVGDVVSQVGGNLIDLTVLFPPGADPHTFEPRPQDIAALSDARVVVISGMGLEEALDPTLKANVRGTIVQASDGIEVLAFGGEQAHGNGDPHTWTDPNNVIVWTENIAAALSEADPANAGTYRANAEAYIKSLQELDAWIRAEIEKVPVERRVLVTDHLVFGYFADEYGLEQVGALIGAFSTSAAPSAQELAALEDRIREQGVPAIFVSKTVNAALAEQVAQDTGIAVVQVYTGSLTAPGGEADSYLAFMHYDVSAIVETLR